MELNEEQFLSEQLSKIEALIPVLNKHNPKISKAGIGWHLDHSLKVINSVYHAVRSSDPAEYKEEFNVARTAIFKIGKIPRGTANSPKSVLPPEQINAEDIKTQLHEARNNSASFQLLDKNQFFKHFGFGNLNRDLAKRFLEIHTNHHLSIIKDIIRSND